MDNARFWPIAVAGAHPAQRALGDEIATSISKLAAVESARAAGPAGTERLLPRAAEAQRLVVVTLRPGHTLDRQQIAAIVHLVSRSVPDLAFHVGGGGRPERHAAVGHPGQQPAGAGFAAAAVCAAQVEHTTSSACSISSSPRWFGDNLRATVTAEIDFTQQESTSEAYKPNQTGSEATLAASAQQRADHAGRGHAHWRAGRGQQPAAHAGHCADGRAPGAAAGRAGGHRRWRIAQGKTSLNHEVDKTVSVKRNASGIIKRLNAAVLVNHRSTTDPKARSPRRSSRPGDGKAPRWCRKASASVRPGRRLGQGGQHPVPRRPRT